MTSRNKPMEKQSSEARNAWGLVKFCCPSKGGGRMRYLELLGLCVQPCVKKKELLDLRGERFGTL